MSEIVDTSTEILSKFDQEIKLISEGDVSKAIHSVKDVKSLDSPPMEWIAEAMAFEFEITQADSFKVNLLADDFLHIRVEKQNDTLIIRRQGIEWFAPFRSQPRVVVTLPALTELNISGASHGKIENFQSDNDLTINSSGASHVEALNISAGKLNVK